MLEKAGQEIVEGWSRKCALHLELMVVKFVKLGSFFQSRLSPKKALSPT